MTKPPFIERQDRRRQLERRRAAQRVRESMENYERLLDDIMALDPTIRMLPSGVH